MNFNQSLRYEEQRLVNVINAEASNTLDGCVYIGPTKVDFSMITQKNHMIPTVELSLTKKWKDSDDSFYRNHTQTQFWD